MKKVVIRVSMHGNLSRSYVMDILIKIMNAMVPFELLWKSSASKNRIKAMQVVAGISGIESVALEGEEKNQIVVSGDDFDPVKLAVLLRRNVGIADILSLDSS